MTEVRFGLSGTGEHVNEHGGSAVDGGAPLPGDGLHTGGPVEAGARDDVGGAVNHSRQCSTHASDTMVKWNGDADTI